MQKEILKILKEVRPDVDFEKETNLLTNEILESFDIIQIVSELMEKFNIEIDADDIEVENLDSLQNICCMVQRKMGK